MSPKIPLHISLYELWEKRLQNCCKHCAEIDDSATNLERTVNNTGSIRQCGGERNYTLPEREEFKTNLVWKPWEQRSYLLKYQTIPTWKSLMMHPVKSTRHPYLQKNIQPYLATTHLGSTIEFIVDTTNDEDDKMDFFKDLFEDLVDAMALEEQNKLKSHVTISRSNKI